MSKQEKERAQRKIEIAIDKLIDAFGPREWGNNTKRIRASDIYEVTADEADELECQD